MVDLSGKIMVNGFNLLKRVPNLHAHIEILNAYVDIIQPRFNTTNNKFVLTLKQQSTIKCAKIFDSTPLESALNRELDYVFDCCVKLISKSEIIERRYPMKLETYTQQYLTIACTSNNFKGYLLVFNKDIAKFDKVTCSSGMKITNVKVREVAPIEEPFSTKRIKGVNVTSHSKVVPFEIK